MLKRTTESPVVPINREQRRVATAKVRRGEKVETADDLLPSGLTAALTTEQAACYTGLAPATLEGLRCRGGGPRFVRYGRKAVRYLVAELDSWMDSLTVASTSEAA